MQGSRHIGEPRCRGAETFSHPNGHDVKGLVDRFVDRFMVCFWAMYRRSKGSIEYAGADRSHDVDQI